MSFWDYIQELEAEVKQLKKLIKEKNKYIKRMKKNGCKCRKVIILEMFA